MAAPDLVTAELTLTGRITTASNATFLGSIGESTVVYKPIAGEHPLWDFPGGTLAQREVAAYLVSQAMEWNIVPRTWLREGPMGTGMVQLWQDQDPAQHPIDLLASDDVPATGWKTILRGQDENDREVTLVHEDSPGLRRMAVFDAVVNNADRKGDHVLAMGDGHRYGVDHGLTFHTDHKLRTVLWGWMDEAMTPSELDGVARVTAGLAGSLGVDLAKLLSAEEIDSLAARCNSLTETASFPAPRGDMPAVPWPLF